MTGLAFVSGGMDSVAMLDHLSRTDEPILVHHVLSITLDLRWRCEALMIQRLQAHYGDRFRWEFSGMSLLGSPTLIPSRDVIWLSVIASVYQAYSDLERVYFGYEHSPGQTATFAGTAMGCTVGVLEKMLPRGGDPRLVNDDPEAVKPLQILAPMAALTKAEEYRLMAPAVKDLFWSCRDPVIVRTRVVGCGRCPTCLTLREDCIPHPIVTLSDLPTDLELLQRWIQPPNPQQQDYL